MSTPNVQATNPYINLQNFIKQNDRLTQVNQEVVDMENQLWDSSAYTKKFGTEQTAENLEKFFSEAGGEDYQKKLNELNELLDTTPYVFNLMANNDGRNYQEQLQYISEQEIAEHDKDGDNKLSAAEFILKETKNLDKNTPKEFVAKAKGYSLLLHDILDKQFGNKDNYMDNKELATFYELADGYQVWINGTTQKFEQAHTGQIDGIVSAGELGDFPEFLVDYFAGEKTVQSAIDMFK